MALDIADILIYNYLMDQDINQSRENFLAAHGGRFSAAIRSSQVATDVFDEALAAFLGINRTDGRCLDIIDRAGRVSAGQLAIESGLTTGAVTAVIDRLEGQGYVRRVRDQLDRRKVWVEVTDDTKAINAHIFGIYEQISPRLMGRFSADQLRAILEFLEVGTLLNREMAAAIKEHHAPEARTPAARLQQASVFERAMQASTPRLLAELDSIRIE